MGMHKFSASVRFRLLGTWFLFSLSAWEHDCLSIRHYNELGLVHSLVGTDDIYIQIPPVLVSVIP